MDRICALNNRLHEILESAGYAVLNNVTQVKDSVLYADRFGNFEQRADRILRGSALGHPRSYQNPDQYIRSVIAHYHPDYKILSDIVKNLNTQVTFEFDGDQYEVTAYKLMSPNYCIDGQTKCLTLNNKRHKLLQEIWGDRYKFQDDLTCHVDDKIEAVCKIHGVFRTRLSQLLSGHGCKRCASILMQQVKTKTQEQYIQDAKKAFGDKYDYSKIEYKHKNSKIKIICPIHGEFIRNARAHLQGAGCPYCKQRVVDTLYLLYDTDTRMFKIGVCSGNPKRRISTIRQSNIIEHPGRIIHIATFEQCGIFEKQIHKILQDWNRVHPYYNAGKSEWFKMDVSPLIFVQMLCLIINTLQAELNGETILLTHCHPQQQDTIFEFN